MSTTEDADGISRADDHRRMFGYFDAQGQWVPGILEAIRNLQNESKEILRKMAEKDAVIQKRIVEIQEANRKTDRWFVRGLVALVLVRFLGWEHLADLVHFFGLHAH